LKWQRAETGIERQVENDAERDERAAQPRGLVQNASKPGTRFRLDSASGFHLRAIMPSVCEKLDRKQKTADESVCRLFVVKWSGAKGLELSNQIPPLISLKLYRFSVVLQSVRFQNVYVFPDVQSFVSRVLFCKAAHFLFSSGSA
jgi:hypothetical protein